MFDKATHEKHIKKILITIFTDDIGKFLAFKGGTLAYLKHNLDRFSTDIDLDILDPTQEERIIKRVREILVMYGDIKGERSFNDSYRFVFRYNQEDMNIKVELNKRVWEHNTYEVQTIEEIDILCMTPDCMFTNKLVALSERFYPRDLYDVEFFNRKKFPLKELLIKERTGLSIKKFTQELVKELPNRLPKNKVLHNLGEVLTKKQQYRVKEYLLDEVVDFLKEKTGEKSEKNNKFIIALVFLFLIIVFLIGRNRGLIKEKLSFDTGLTSTGIDSQSGLNNISTGTIGEHTKVLVVNQNGIKKDKTLNDFPKIKINDKIKNVQLIAEITFTDYFVKNYQYENSNGYFFGLKFFLGDFNNGGYYGVYRKQSGGIGNSLNDGLFGARLASEVRDGTTRYIPLTNHVSIAVDANNRTPTYQFTYFDAEGYLNSHVGKEIPIGVYLSSVSELKGWELTYIKSLKIVYIGKENAVEVVK